MRSAVAISLMLHMLVITLLVWGPSTQNAEFGSGGTESTVIDAIMVDPKAVTQHYNRQQQQQIDTTRAQEQRQKKALQQAEELQKKQIAEQRQRLRELEKERLQAQIAAEEQQRHAAEQQKQASAMATKAKEEQKKAEIAAANAREKQLEAQRALAETRQKAIAEAKKAAEKQSSDVDKLLGGLASAKNAPQTGVSATGKEVGKKNGASTSDINNYLGQIKTAIEANFHDAALFKGLTCSLRIKLAPDGAVVDVKAEGGDPALCAAAVVAARQARIPKPPSQELYDIFKNAPLIFKPQ